jgi:hypothetical protein
MLKANDYYEIAISSDDKQINATWYFLILSILIERDWLEKSLLPSISHVATVEQVSKTNFQVEKIRAHGCWIFLRRRSGDGGVSSIDL